MTRFLVLLIWALLASAWAQDVILEPTTLGNVFAPSDTLSVGVETGADTLHYTLSDLWGDTVMVGTQDAAARLELSLPEGASGFFRLAVRGERDGESVGYAETTLAVLPAFSAEGESIFGAQMHFAQFKEGMPPEWDAATRRYVSPGESRVDPVVASLLQRAGVAQVRDELPWNRIEPEKGVYAFAGMYETYVQALAGAGIGLLSILNYGNANYDIDAEGLGAFPNTDEGRTGYADYAAALLEHFGDRIEAVEVWNEPNSAAPWNRGPCRNVGPPLPNPEHVRCYAAALAAVADAVERAQPETTVVGPAAVGAPIGYFAALADEGALENLTALSFHPYVYPDAPETLLETFDKLTAFLSDRGAQDLALYATEVGWPTHQGDRSVSERTQAAYLARTYSLTLANGIDRLFWYDFVNDGVSVSDVEANFGLVRAAGDPQGAYTPKPGYVAYAVTAQHLTGAVPGETPETPEGVQVYTFSQGGTAVSVLWGLEPQTVRLESAGPLEVTDLSGSADTTLEGDSLMLSVTPSAGPESYGFVLALTEAGPQLYQRIAPEGEVPNLVEDAELSITQDAALTTYTLALPWSDIAAVDPAQGTAQLALQVNDNDGEGRQGWLEWGAGLGRNTPSTWRQVQFLP